MNGPTPHVELSFAEFTSAAAVLVAACREVGSTAPTFRTPPRLPRRDRTIRRRRDGSVTVAVRLDGRPWMAAVADMVDGCLVANHASADTAPNGDERLRRALWHALAARWAGPSLENGRPRSAMAPLGRLRAA